MRWIHGHRGWFLPALLIGSCSPLPRFELELPKVAGTKALILAFEPATPNTSPALSELLTIDLSAPAPDVLPWVPSSDRGRGTRFTALFYQERLDQLGLGAGPIAIVAPADPAYPRARGLPQPAAIYEADLNADATPVFNPIPALGMNLSGIRIPPPLRCAELVGRPVLLPNVSKHNLAFAIWVRTATVFLLGTDDGQLFVIDPSATVSRAEHASLTDRSFRALAAFVGPQQELWLGGDGGRLSAAKLTRSATGAKVILTGSFTSSSGHEIRYIDGGSTPDGLELFASTRQGDLLRFDQASHSLSWLTSIPAPTDPSRPVARVSIAWEGPARATAVVAGDLAVHRYRGQRFVEDLLQSAPGRLSVVRRVPMLGTVLATEPGPLLADAGQGWVVLDMIERSVEVQALEPYGAGLIYAGLSGLAGQYYADVHLCPLRNVASDEVTAIAVRPDDGSVVLGGLSNPQTLELFVTLARPH